MNDDGIVCEDDDAAAKLIEDYPVTGWVSRKGNFFGSGPQAEQMARYDGSTHKKCSTCGNAIPKHSHCQPCHDKKIAAAQRARYATLPKAQWDGETPLYSLTYDKWFCDEDEIYDYCEELCEGMAITPKDLLLVVGIPVKANVVHLSTDVYADYLSDDDTDIPPEIQKLFDDFNERLAACEVTLSWTASNAKFAVDMTAWNDKETR